VEIWSNSPPIDLDGWGDVVEVGQTTDSGTVAVDEPLGKAPPLPLLEIDADTWYRIRAHCRGREAGRQHVATVPPEPVEEHLVQLWPAPKNGEKIYKQTTTDASK
jgi:hypothetical protein